MPSIQPIMKYVERFTVTGLTVRTRNSDEFNQETAKLPNLWQQFYARKPTPDTTIFGVYSNYESDASGPYNVTVGTTHDKQHAELSAIKIHPGNYLVFHGKGAMPLTVIETWKRVWDCFTGESSYQRCFMTDFEAHSNSDEVAIYIGVK